MDSRIARSILRKDLRERTGLDVRPDSSPPIGQALTFAAPKGSVAAFCIGDFAVVVTEVEFDHAVL